MLQSVVAEYLVEGRDLPLLLHGAAAVLLEPTNEHAADARLNGDHASVVEQVSRAGVRQWLVQLELATRRLQVADSLVLGPEPLVPAQRVVIGLDDRQLVLGTDGLGPFTVTEQP